jgi:hypothetical protein
LINCLITGHIVKLVLGSNWLSQLITTEALKTTSAIAITAVIWLNIFWFDFDSEDLHEIQNQPRLSVEFTTTEIFSK